MIRFFHSKTESIGLFLNPPKASIELLDPNRSWFRCLECGRAWSPFPLIGRMPKGWHLCPAGCNAPAPDLRVVTP